MKILILLGGPWHAHVSEMFCVVLLSYNYDQPVSIVLPPEAEEVIEVPIQ